MKKQKIIIDTDPGHDDTMALMLALNSPEFEVLAVTTVCGNSTIDNVTRNARFVLDFLRRNDVPVYSGAAQPLKRPLIQAVVHGKSGLAGHDPTNEPGLTGDAPEQIIKLVKANPGEVTVVTIGPLTNIALAIQRDQTTMKLVKQIVMMGGAVAVPGNKNRVAEFNVFVDPDAAQIVMRFDVPKTLVPLDACNHVLLQLGDVQNITNRRTRNFMLRMLRPYVRNIKADVGVEGALMYDVLTVFYLLQPEACKTQPMNIQVEMQSDLTRGMTVADRRPVPDKIEPNATVVTDIDAAAFTQCFIAALSRSSDSK